MINNKSILYLGFNSMLVHKRGVENVIDFQSKASNGIKYYIHWAEEAKVYKFNEFVCIGLKKSFFWPISLNLIIKKLRFKNLIIHSHNSLMSFFSIKRTNIFTVHDSLYFSSIEKKHRFTILFYLIEKLVYLRSDLVHFISHYTKSRSLFSQKSNNYIIIYNTSHLESSIVFNQAIEQQKQITNCKKFTILIVRSIEERANLDLILEISDYLKKNNIEINIVGKGPLLSHYNLLFLKKDIDSIKLLGFVNDNDLINLYSKSDLIILPAIYGEGFGLPIIEAYLFNKPVLASNVCAIPEIIISEEYLFENNKDSLISKIEQYKNCKMKNNSFRFFYNKNYSNDLIVSQFKEIYNNLDIC